MRWPGQEFGVTLSGVGLGEGVGFTQATVGNPRGLVRERVGSLRLQKTLSLVLSLVLSLFLSLSLGVLVVWLCCPPWCWAPGLSGPAWPAVLGTRLSDHCLHRCRTLRVACPFATSACRALSRAQRHVPE